MKFLYKKHSYPPPPPHSKKAGYFNNLRTFIHAFSKVFACLLNGLRVQKVYIAISARFLKGWRVQTGAGVLRNISKGICEKGVQKLKHAFCHTRVLQTRCAQSRTRFEPPFHKIIICFFFIPSFPRKRESSSRKAGLFTSTCFRLKSCFCFTLSRVQQINRVAGRACYFAAGLSRLKGLFHFTMSRVRNWSRVAITGSAGFGLVETLVVAGVSLTLGYGIIKTSLVGMQTNAIVHTSLKEQDLIHTVRTTLGNPVQCKYNLDPDELTTAGTPPKTTVSEIKNSMGNTDKTDDISLIKAGENFKNNPLIHIQQMELSGTGSDRTFTLYYKKPQLGSLSSPGTCTDSDPSGCYFIACKVDYACSGDGLCSAGSDVTTCAPRNCATGGSGGGGVASVSTPCYKADSEATQGKVLIGCDRGTGDGIETTAIGFGAGKANTGAGNTFIGKEAGKSAITGGYNTYIGFRAGSNNIMTGSRNIAIGYYATPASSVESNQINIGDIIQAKQINRSPTDPTKIGVINVCNAQGRECMPISRKALTCPEGHYFKGIKSDGTADCAPDVQCPTSHNNFWKTDNKCHRCPRASPLYLASVPPASCTPPKIKSGLNCCKSCPLNTSYIVSNNTCRPNCPTGQILVSGTCKCPLTTQKYITDTCQNCPSPRQWVGNTCKCRLTTQKYISGQCRNCPYPRRWYGNTCRCTSGRKYVGGQCKSCPSPRRWYGNTCRCASGRKYVGGQCRSCPSPRRWYGNTCRCASGQKFISNTCQSCPAPRQWVGNICRCPDGGFFEPGSGKCYTGCSNSLISMFYEYKGIYCLQRCPDTRFFYHETVPGNEVRSGENLRDVCFIHWTIRAICRGPAPFDDSCFVPARTPAYYGL